MYKAVLVAALLMTLALTTGTHMAIACEPGSNGCEEPPITENPALFCEPGSNGCEELLVTDSAPLFCEPGSNGC